MAILEEIILPAVLKNRRITTFRKRELESLGTKGVNECGEGRGEGRGGEGRGGEGRERDLLGLRCAPLWTNNSTIFQ